VAGRVDQTTLLVTSLLLLVGLIALYSASAPFSLKVYGSALLDYHVLAQINDLLLLGAVGLSVLTILPIGIADGRWLMVGPFPIQPTEFVKLSLIVYLATAIDRKSERMTSFKEGVLPFLLILIVLAGIVLNQPDLGMLLLYAAVTVVLLFIGGARLRHLAAVGVAGVPLVYLAIRMAPYRFARILSFLNPEAYSTSSGYQILQSLTAIGAGGVFGRGLGASRAKLFYLPQAHNDFILSVVGEETGLIGTVVVLALLGLLVWRAFVIAERAPDRLGRLLAYGIGFCIGFQALLNAGVALGVLPVTGLTLPFLSNGGSSLLITLSMVGVLLGISRREEAR
jgi:cell division protein FtsW